MYVCICQGVTERRIREAVAAGDTSFEALQDSLDIATCCGCCEDEVRAVLADCLQTQRNNTRCGFLPKTERADSHPVLSATVLTCRDFCANL